jgi:hypothetical protein
MRRRSRISRRRASGGDRHGGRLTPTNTFDITWACEYADDDDLGREMLATAGIAELVGPSREEDVRRQIVEALARYRKDDRGYRLANEFLFRGRARVSYFALIREVGPAGRREAGSG